MAYIETLPPQESTGEVRAMYQRQQVSWGYVPNYAKAFSHRPEVLARWGQLLAEIRRPMDARRFELITFAAAHELRNTACALAHGKALLPFLGAEGVRALAEQGTAPGLTAAEERMLAFARKVARDATRVTRDDAEGLRACGFSDAEIFDIAATAAGRAFFTKLLDALGVQADAPALKMDGPLRAALDFGGLPIDNRAPETIPLED